jgi:8-oxo-dGTP pyrophosphatase MutT (NUDIX family)
MKEYAALVLRLPDNRYVMQRRDSNGSSPGELAVFGGGVEDDRTIDMCRHNAAPRELEEELGFGVADLNFIGDFFYPSLIYPKPIIRINVYAGRLAALPTIKEGDCAEAYTGEEILSRHDVAYSTKAVMLQVTGRMAHLL